MAASTHITAPRGLFVSHLVASIQTLREHIARRQDFRRTVIELSKLNTHQLSDLGLNRSNLRQAAHKATCKQLR